jgi:hypothetical protein
MVCIGDGIIVSLRGAKSPTCCYYKYISKIIKKMFKFFLSFALKNQTPGRKCAVGTHFSCPGRKMCKFKLYNIADFLRMLDLTNNIISPLKPI